MIEVFINRIYRIYQICDRFPILYEPQWCCQELYHKLSNCHLLLLLFDAQIIHSSPFPSFDLASFSSVVENFVLPVSCSIYYYAALSTCLTFSRKFVTKHDIFILLRSIEYLSDFFKEVRDEAWHIHSSTSLWSGDQSQTDFCAWDDTIKFETQLTCMHGCSKYHIQLFNLALFMVNVSTLCLYLGTLF